MSSNATFSENNPNKYFLGLKHWTHEDSREMAVRVVACVPWRFNLQLRVVPFIYHHSEARFHECRRDRNGLFELRVPGMVLVVSYRGQFVSNGPTG